MTFDELKKGMLEIALGHDVPRIPLWESIRNWPDGYYLVAKPEMSRKQWEDGEFAPYIASGGVLLGFLTNSEACAFASRQKAIIDDHQMVRKFTREQFSQCLAELQDVVQIVKFYTRVPLALIGPASDFILDTFAKPASALMQEENPTRPVEFKGVDLVRQTLDARDKNTQNKLDPGGRLRNIHTAIQNLSQYNSIEPEELDAILELPKGYTRGFFNNVKNSNPSKEILLKYLSYFGLQEYLYAYKNDCRELLAELKQRKSIDLYSVKAKTKMAGAERFCLKSVERGRDRDGFFVYKLTLKSKYRNEDFTMIVSDAAGCVEGREYVIEGLAPPKDMKDPTATSQHRMMSEEEMKHLAKSLEDKENVKKKRAETVTRTYDEQRKDSIIAYFRKQGIDGRAAEAKYKALEMECDILDEFYKFVTTKKYGKVEIAGYSARRLVEKLHYSPYEAYLNLIALRANPGETKQRLVYRETDPQYQPAQKTQRKEGQ